MGGARGDGVRSRGPAVSVVLKRTGGGAGLARATSPEKDCGLGARESSPDFGNDVRNRSVLPRVSPRFSVV